MTHDPPPPTGETFLTVRDVADRLRVRPKTVVRWCRAGDLPSVRPGRQYLIRPEALRDYLAARDVSVARPTPRNES